MQFIRDKDGTMLKVRMFERRTGLLGTLLTTKSSTVSSTKPSVEVMTAVI